MAAARQAGSVRQGQTNVSQGVESRARQGAFETTMEAERRVIRGLLPVRLSISLKRNSQAR